MSKLIVQQPIIHVPAPREFEITPQAFRAKLKNIKQIYLWDNKFWYISHEDWGKLFHDVLFDLPKYQVDKYDCENFCISVSARISERYKLNTCGIAIGDGPTGRHGFNIFLSEVGLYYLEPQSGDIFSVDENSGYSADIVIFG